MQTWISVKDALPEEYKMVLIAARVTDDPDMDPSYWLGTYQNGEWLDDLQCEIECYTFAVTHWMEIPGLPEKGDCHATG